MERYIPQMGIKGPGAQAAFKAGDGDLEVFSRKGVPRNRGNCQRKKYPERK